MSGIVEALNHPVIKQGIKNISGAVICGKGAVALYHAMSGKIYTQYAEPSAKYPAVDRVTLAFAQASLVLSATVTPQSMWALSKVVNRVFTSAQLEEVFGPNTIFEANWKHPRHLVSLAAVGLALPLVLKHLFIPPANEDDEELQKWTLFTVIFSRPVLHQGNLLAHKLINYFK